MSISSIKEKHSQEVNQISINNFWLLTEGLRLDAKYYFENVFDARNILSKFRGIPLIDISDKIYNLNRFKRIYSEIGKPYLSASEAFLFRPREERYLNISDLDNSNLYFVKKDWIIITCSGTIGRINIIQKYHEKYLFTHDLIRIILKNKDILGYVYAFLSTWVGQTLLKKGEYGATVKHIEPEHIKNIKIPYINKIMMKNINDDIIKAFNYREKAINILNEIEDKLYNLFDNIDIDKEKKSKYFIQHSKDLEYRMDASYHNLVKRKIINIIENSDMETIFLGKITNIFMPNRFKRIYVDKQYGIPFLQGKNLVELKPFDLKYISKQETKNLNNLLIHKGDILLTRSGTIGRVALTPSEWDGWAASEHIIRLTLQKKYQFLKGYVAAFLASKIGKILLLSKSFGAVVDEISIDHIKDIIIPIPKKDFINHINELYVEAYELKGISNSIENAAIIKLETFLEREKETMINKDTSILNVYEDSLTIAILTVLNKYGEIKIDDLGNMTGEHMTDILSSIDILYNNKLIYINIGIINITNEGINFLNDIGLVND